MKKIKVNPLMIFVLVLFVLGLVIAAYQLGSKNANLLGFNSVDEANHQASKDNNSINFSSWGDEDRQAYFTGQIMAPSDYLATSDDMVTHYGTQGGMAPPRLILTKGYQALPKDTSDYSYMDFGDSDCILVWSTNGFNSVEAWGQSIGRIDGNIVKKESIRIDNREANVYQATNKGKDKYVAYLPIGNSGGTSYFFETCNMNNKTDFENVIKSIKFRSDLNY